MVLETPFIKNQVTNKGEINCCLSAAITVCMEVIEAQNGAIKELSMLYHYHFASRSDPFKALTVNEGIMTAEDDGVCEKRLHAYPLSPDIVSMMPSVDAEFDGEDRILESGGYEIFHNPHDINKWKARLSKHVPLILLFHLNKNLYDALEDSDYVHPMPNDLASTSGHAVVVIGYDNVNRHFIIQDCRGSDWCDEGRWYLPFDVANSLSFTHTVLVITKTSKGEIG